MFSNLLTTDYVYKRGASREAYGKKSSDGKTFYWYTHLTTSADYQFNTKGITYYYIVIG